MIGGIERPGMRRRRQGDDAVTDTGSTPEPFALGCFVLALLLAGAGAGELVPRGAALALAALVATFGLLVRLVAAERRQYELGAPAGDGASDHPPAPVALGRLPDGLPSTETRFDVVAPELPPSVNAPGEPVRPAPGREPVTFGPVDVLADEPEDEPLWTAYEPEPPTVRRTFRLPASVGAERVWLVGEFNCWSRTATPMVRDGDAFVVELALEPGRAYRYRYLLDGERWENDWAADGYVANGFGTEDSVAQT